MEEKKLMDLIDELMTMLGSTESARPRGRWVEAPKSKSSPSKKPRRSKTAYQLKISLNGIRPPIWRRVLVPGHATFHELHLIIQEAMGWEQAHLYEFDFGSVLVGLPDGWDSFQLEKELMDARRIKLQQWLTEEKQKFLYIYDFGDYWRHIITVEKIETVPKPLERAACLKGKRACPPEDCGGVYGYLELLEAAAQKDSLADPELRELVDWMYDMKGNDFDPDAFDVEEANERLAYIRL
ncbi:plasmid pRiA4b ORF-3 family protein [Caldibacillus thermoamylovorans]